MAFDVIYQFEIYLLQVAAVAPAWCVEDMSLRRGVRRTANLPADSENLVQRVGNNR